MSDYTPPVKELMFALDKVVGLEGLLGGLEADDIQMILASAGQLAADVIAPLNHIGDQVGSKLGADGKVVTPPGFKEAYTQYSEGGWNSVPFNEEFGGQGLPYPIAFALQEMWQSAGLAFGLCPLLNQAAVEAIDNHGTPEQQALYLEKLISGEWTGTMNLTEPHAGTDLGAITTKAIRQDDGTYRITGQKIFITYGEHDWTENIIQMVLARVPGAPEGTKGISMFIVPKYLLDEDGKPGKRNDWKCVSLEHKMGIHASPTCTISYGDEGGATGFLIGEENAGLKYMFTMMNNARLSVGLQGVGVSERAYQKALAYARERRQGARLSDKGGESVPIIEHADVRRMLLEMKALTEAARALTLEAGKAMDLAGRGDAHAQGLVDLLTPVVKAWCTDMSVQVTSLGVQVFGGMGFIEETGAAQYYRDARILPIYEGANGIQAMDLSFRKVLQDGGKRANTWFEDARTFLDSQNRLPEAVKADLAGAIDALEEATNYLLDLGSKGELEAIAAVTVSYLQAFGYIAGGMMMGRAAAAALNWAEEAGSDAEFCQQKTDTVLFYIGHILPRYRSHLETVKKGGDAVTAFASSMFRIA